MAIRSCTLSKARSRRGFTLVELSISMAISAMVMIAIAGLQYFSSRSIQELYGQARTRSSRMQALDQIRFRLCEARVGSIVCSELTESGKGYHRIQFVDPNLGGPPSGFFFVTSTRTLFYDRNIADSRPPQPIVVGPIEISFDVQSGGAMVMLSVRSAADMSYGDVDLQDGETAVYVRNT